MGSGLGSFNGRMKEFRHLVRAGMEQVVVGGSTRFTAKLQRSQSLAHEVSFQIEFTKQQQQIFRFGKPGLFAQDLQLHLLQQLEQFIFLIGGLQVPGQSAIGVDLQGEVLLLLAGGKAASRQFNRLVIFSLP